MIDYGKTKEILGETQCMDWIKLTVWHQLVNINWLADIDWLNELT